MTPTLRRKLRKTGEFKRTDGIRLVNYDGPQGKLYVAYRWPSGRVQWYRYIVTTIVLTPPKERPVDVEEEEALWEV